MRQLFLSAVLLIFVGSCTVVYDEQPVQHTQAPKQSLPAKCRPFYNDGTGRWIECMGVGLK